jgi:hypothetical protein
MIIGRVRLGTVSLVGLASGFRPVRVRVLARTRSDIRHRDRAPGQPEGTGEDRDDEDEHQTPSGTRARILAINSE